MMDYDDVGWWWCMVMIANDGWWFMMMDDDESIHPNVLERGTHIRQYKATQIFTLRWF